MPTIIKKYREAASSFETTYKKFPNKIPDNLKDKAPGSRNHYHKVSLYRWGTAEQGAEEYAGALKLYEKFLADKPEREPIPQQKFSSIWEFVMPS